MGDNVNHPNHYQNIAGVEAIDILNDVVKDLPGKQAAMLWNTLKYLLRFQKKNGVEDLKKAQNYLQWLIDDIEATDTVKAKPKNHRRSNLPKNQGDKPLTPIEDTDDVWNLIDNHEDGYISYQCKRMSSLFKDVYADGTVKYDDISRSYCVDINNSNNKYSSGLVRRIIDAMFPITMPYMPGKPIKVYCEDFLTDKKNGDFDTVGVFYALKTENDKQEKIEIDRFFRAPKGDEKGAWIEISKDEYMQRKDKRLNAFLNKEDN